MNKLVFLIIGVGIWFAFDNKDLIQKDTNINNNEINLTKNKDLVEKDIYINETNFQNKSTSSKFTCDGREYCNQMNSCEEATYFISHCPNTKMDGNHDGVPCERQWCN